MYQICDLAAKLEQPQLHDQLLHFLYRELHPEAEQEVLITIYEERIIVFYGRAIPAICVTQNATQLESQKGASKHSH